MFRRCRRGWGVLLCCAWLWPNSAMAGEPIFQDGNFVPYVELPASQSAVTRGLERRVMVFVHFSCPYCRGIHPALTQWSRNLPPGISFEVVPAVGLQSHVPMALAYYAVLATDPRQLEAYTTRLYTLLQDQRRSVERPETFVEAAAATGIPRERFLAAVQSEEVRQYAVRAQALTRAYGLEEVPSVVVGNRFLTSPRRVQNQSEAFITVMNGLVSMLY
jgi:thiol:disulfide interchange protein DsbA